MIFAKSSNKMNVTRKTDENQQKLILICRTCGEPSESYINIFGEEGTTQSLSKKISSYLQVEVSNYDLLPKIVCNKCYHKLEEFHNFFLASKKVQPMLKDAINESLFSIMIKIDTLNDKASSEDSFKLKLENEDVAYSYDKDEDGSQASEHDKDENVINNNPDVKEMLPVDTKNNDNFRFNEIHRKLSKISSTVHESKAVDNSSDCHSSDTNLLLNQDLDIGKNVNSPVELKTEDDFSDSNSVSEAEIDLMDVSIQLSCVSCTEVFRNPRELIDHFNEQHCDKVPVFKCSICGSLRKNLKKFYTHYHNHENDKYKCKICGKLFTRQWSLKLHAAVHTDTKPYNCDQCNKSFKTVNALRDHKKKHLPDEDKPLYTCTYCSKSFRSKFILTSHMRNHTGEANFICNLCSKSFVSKSSLIYHMSIHNYQESIKCHLCNKLLRTEKLLLEHLATHSSKKLLKCEYCGKQYRFPSLLKQHQRLHTGELPYKCEDCPKRFRLRNALITHQRQHTGVKPFKCKTCDRAFTDFANFNKHMKRKHYNTNVEKEDKLIQLKIQNKNKF